MKQGFLIPVYRHAATAGPLAEKLAQTGLPVIVIDDGNSAEEKDCLIHWAAKTPGLFLVHLEKNMGKGAAVLKGFEKAAQLGLTHVFQIDADGQHDISRVSFFLEESAKHPNKIICGYPVFDESAPKHRIRGRKIVKFWASVCTLSGDLADLLCGFRVYPVEASLAAVKSPFFDKRMGFDSEILVRLYWNRVFPVFYPVQVIYPKDGISNFRAFWDTFNMLCMLLPRMLIGFLFRLPRLIVIRKEYGKETQ